MIGVAFISVQRRRPTRSAASWVRTVLATLLILGVLGTGYQVFMLRMFPVLVDRSGDSGTKLGGSEPAIRQAGICVALGLRNSRCAIAFFGRPARQSIHARIASCTCYIPVMLPPPVMADVEQTLAVTLRVCAERVQELAALFGFPMAAI